MPSDEIDEAMVEAIASKVIEMMKQMAPTEVEPEVEEAEPEAPEPIESGEGETGEAENAVEFDPYAIAIAAAEAVLLEDEE